MAVKANWQNGEQFNASDANAVAEAVNAAYVKPTGGVPITDLTASVQVSLGKADTAVQSVNAASITDSTTTGRAVITAVDAAAARTTLGVSYGTTAGTVVEGNDSRLSPSSTSITDSTATGRSLLTAVDPAAARSAIGVAYGSTGGTVAQGNDSRIVGAEQTANKGVANGYASLDGGGKVPVSQLPSSIMEYQGTFNASTGSPTLANGTGNTGDVYRVTVAGTQNFGAGNISFEVGDYVIYNGSVWEKSDTTDAVSTVAGLTGDVSASSLRGAIATGTPSSSTWLRGDGAWATIPASGITRSVQTITEPTTLGAAANTDYVYFLHSASVTTPSSDPQAANVRALLYGNGTNASTTIVDSSAVASNWTASGTVQLSTSNPKYGSASILMAGSGNVTATAASSNYALPGDFTVEFWYRPTSGFGDKVLYDHGPTATASVCFITAAGGQVLLFSDSAQRITGTTTLQVGTWYHLAACRSGSTLRLFVNGVQEGSSYTTSTSFGATQPRIGSYYTGTFNAVGAFDDFRITTAARYTSNFTPPAAELPSPIAVTTTTVGTPTLPTAVGNTNQYTLKNITSSIINPLTTSSQTIDGASTTTADSAFNTNVALLRGDGANNSTSIIDSSASATAWSVSGNARISTAEKRFGTGSIYFDGTSNTKISPPSATPYAFGTDDFCIEFWLFVSVSAAVYYYDSRPNGGGGSYIALFSAAGGNVTMLVNNSAVISSGNFSANTWVHFALCRSGTTTRMFLNGTQTGSSYTDTNNYLCAAGGPVIGMDAPNQYRLNGYMDEIRISRGAGAGRYTSNFSAPTAEFPGAGGGTMAAGSLMRLISDGSNWRTV